jgi:hypothetical protein
MIPLLTILKYFNLARLTRNIYSLFNSKSLSSKRFRKILLLIVIIVVSIASYQFIYKYLYKTENGHYNANGLYVEGFKCKSIDKAIPSANALGPVTGMSLFDRFNISSSSFDAYLFTKYILSNKDLIKIDETKLGELNGLYTQIGEIDENVLTSITTISDRRKKYDCGVGDYSTATMSNCDNLYQLYQDLTKQNESLYIIRQTGGRNYERNYNTEYQKIGNIQRRIALVEAEIQEKTQNITVKKVEKDGLLEKLNKLVRQIIDNNQKILNNFNFMNSRYGLALPSEESSGKVSLGRCICENPTESSQQVLNNDNDNDNDKQRTKR